MDSWSIALWVVAGYIAVVALMRLMAHKRNEVMAEFRGEVEKEKSRRKIAAAKAGQGLARQSGVVRQAFQPDFAPVYGLLSGSGTMYCMVGLTYFNDQARLYRDCRLPDERAGQRTDRFRPRPGGLRTGR